MSRKPQGHPARTNRDDPAKQLERKVDSLMRQAVALNKEIQTNHTMPQEIHEYAQSAALGLLAIYGYLTGLPSPWDSRAAEMGWDKV